MTGTKLLALCVPIVVQPEGQTNGIVVVWVQHHYDINIFSGGHLLLQVINLFLRFLQLRLQVVAEGIPFAQLA